LFIDDEEEITFMGKRMLESLGYKVSIYTNSIAALEDFVSNPNLYDLIVSDQTMPNMLGTDMVEKMKQLRPDLKAVIITGFGDSITEEVAKNKGINAIVIKPLILSKFSNLIRKILDKQVTKL
ncbi:MAG: response regulator, partial [Bacteroidales bacterium]|nr:response regulator [Bacteroidales bacterium]